MKCMWNFLNNWRQKDEGARRTLALSISGGATLLIAVVWAVAFFPHAETPAAAVRASQAPSPLDTLREESSRAFQGIQEQAKNVGTAFTAAVQALSTTTGTSTPTTTPSEKRGN